MYTWESLEWEGMLHSQEGDYWYSSIGEEICRGCLGHVASTDLKAQKFSLVCHEFSHKWLTQRTTAAPESQNECIHGVWPIRIQMFSTDNVTEVKSESMWQVSEETWAGLSNIWWTFLTLSIRLAPNMA